MGDLEKPKKNPAKKTPPKKIKDTKQEFYIAPLTAEEYTNSVAKLETFNYDELIKQTEHISTGDTTIHFTADQLSKDPFLVENWSQAVNWDAINEKIKSLTFTSYDTNISGHLHYPYSTTTNPISKKKDNTDTMSTNDPIENYGKLMKKESIGVVLSKPPRGHQTLIVVHTSSNSGAKFRERSARFVGSLNLETTIKADVISVSDGVMRNGLSFTGKKPGGLEVDAHGYAQVCILKEVNSS